MNNNELNALVAERVMNLRNVRLFMDSNMFVYDDIRTYAIDARGKETITYQPVPIPNYVNDIAAAWQVLEHFQNIGKAFLIMLKDDCKTWGVSNAEDGGLLAGWDADTEDFYIWEESLQPSRAICLAALKAVGVEVE